ncbi:MAG TPA: hypothetical protein VF203_11780 [Burkholderiales bacterium]
MPSRKTVRKHLAAHIAGAACVIAACAIAPRVYAQAADWKPQLVAPPGNVYGPNDPIRLRLPPLPVEVLQTLALELDDFDVTGFVSSDGELAVLTPPQPLAYGEHQLRLVENAPDGSIIERGVWTVSVRKSAAFREAGLQAAVTLNALRRIADDDLPEPAAKRDQWNGAAQLQGAVADGNWRFTGQADLLASGERALLPRGEEGDHIDLGSFLLGYENGPVVARAGHHSVGPDSLIMSGFGRRGVSLGLQSARTGAAATAFSLRTADVIGFQEGFGIGDSDNRTDGVTVTFRPLGGATDALYVSATYLKGEGPSQSGAVGTGIAGDTTAVEGRAASVIADGTLLERRLRLRGEYAATRFDFDGDGRDLNGDNFIDSTENLAPERDDAYHALVTFTPWHDKLVGGQPFAWNLGVENKRIGTFFRSPANPIGVSDRELVRGFTGVNWSAFDAQLSIGRERDNVNDLPLIAQTETAQNVLSLTYAPQPAYEPLPDGSLPPPSWYGQPLLNLSLIDVDQDIVRAGLGLTPGALNKVRTLALTASFTYPTWSWTLGHTIGKSENFIGQAPDTKTDASQLSASFRIGERWTFGPSVQWSRTDESDVPVDFGYGPRRLETLTAGLNIGYLHSDRVSATFGYNLNRSDASDGSQDVRTSDVIANVAWTVVPAREMRPGLTLALDGQWHDFDDRVFAGSNVNHYQIFLRASVSWLPTW